MKISTCAELTVRDIRNVALKWINQKIPDMDLKLGLPEYDDRYDLWRIPLIKDKHQITPIGELKVNGDKKIIYNTDISLIMSRIAKNKTLKKITNRTKAKFKPLQIPNQIHFGDAEYVLKQMKKDSVQLMITSPPYYNAKPQYSEYLDYKEYLRFLKQVFSRVHRILSDGRFCIINVSPVLVRRTSRSTSSRRIPIPYDINPVMESIGFEFIDDIIWVKPEGAGWNIGRGRRFAADRQPLQYKPVPVTEHILVYRKQTDKLIDWNIRQHHDRNLIDDSLILGKYDVTNIWHIHPAFHKIHPAVFPAELVKRLIRYYSFKDDLVLDPFAGSGIVGKVANEMDRRFMLIDNEVKYFNSMKSDLKTIKDLQITKHRR